MKQILHSPTDQTTPTWNKGLAMLSLGFACILNVGAEERIMVEATINGQKAHLAFDTGAPRSLLFRSAALRLGVKIIESQPSGRQNPGEVWVVSSEPFRLTLGSSTVLTSFGIVDSAITMGVDGVLSWNEFGNNIIQIDAQSRKLIFLDKLPDSAAQWPHYKLIDNSRGELNSRWLGFELPQTNARRSECFIDTGDVNGIRLNSATLKKWLAANPSAPVTVSATYYPGMSDGLVVREEYWASHIDLAERLQLSDVPLTQCPLSEETVEGFEATLGLFALTRLNVVLDRISNTIYLKPVNDRTNSYTYNRLGAVFTPRDIKGGDLIARVIKGTPAGAAGIRDGDVLLKIGDLDATQWQTDPRILPLSRFWEQPANTKLDLTYRRQAWVTNAIIELKEIFPRAVSPAKAEKN